MTYHRIVCSVCGWLLHEWREWNVYPDRVQVVDSECRVCHDRRPQEPASWFEQDLGEAGA